MLSIGNMIKKKRISTCPFLSPIWGLNEIEPILMHMSNTEIYFEESILLKRTLVVSFIN